jgi:ADP-ribose pyrophosphatase
MEYTTIESEVVFQGKVFNIRVDKVQKIDGQRMRVDVVEHGGAVVIVPLINDSHIRFVDQYRYPTGRRLLELPAGTLDPGEDPEVCAIRECREEIGMSPARLTHLGELFLAPGYSTECIQVFLAQDLSAAPLAQDADEDIIVRQFSISNIREMISKGEFHDSKTLAGLFLTFQYLGTFAW